MILAALCCHDCTIFNSIKEIEKWLKMPKWLKKWLKKVVRKVVFLFWKFCLKMEAF